MRSLFLIIIYVSVTSGFAQDYQYGLKPQKLNDYLEQKELSDKFELIDLEKFISNIILDIRYSTENNFTKEKIYNLPKAYARKPVAIALQKAQAEFNKLGYGIKIFDAYRPYAATVKLYEVYRDTTYVASPYRGSRHNRGCAIDMTIVDLKTGKELNMPTEFDSFEKAAWPSTPVADPAIRKNRKTLIDVMQRNGFKVNSSEWWHFDFIGWKNYPVMDVSFEELLKINP